MGIDNNCAKFFRHEVRRGFQFGSTLTLGQQDIYMTSGQYSNFFRSILPEQREKNGSALLQAMGATEVSAMDISPYEGATVLHDLNYPIPSELCEKFDCVFDGGALEHIFNFPTALKGCLEMVKVGGSFITATMTNNYCGHGFYQFSPELFFSALSPENGYAVRRALVVCRERWFEVKKPAEIGNRIELITSDPVQLFVLAERIAASPIFSEWPQQSDYVQMWKQKNTSNITKLSLKDALVKVIPGAQTLQIKWREIKQKREFSLKNKNWYSPTDIDKLLE